MKIYEYHVNDGTVDISDNNYDATQHPLFHFFKSEQYEKLGDFIGWEIDSDMKRLGYFFIPNSETIKAFNVVADSLLFMGIFYTVDGARTVRIITQYNGSEYTSHRINYVSYNQDTPDNVSYELRITDDVLKFITLEEINSVKNKIPNAEYFSHIKVRDNQLIKVYFASKE